VRPRQCPVRPVRLELLVLKDSLVPQDRQDRQGQRERPERLELLELLVPQVRLVQLVRPPLCLALRDRLELLVQPERLAQPEPRERPRRYLALLDLQVRRVRPEQLVPKGYRAFRVSLGRPVLLERQVQLVPKAYRVLLGQPVPQERLVPRVHKAWWDPRDQQVQRVLRPPCPVLLVPQDRRERLALKVQREQPRLYLARLVLPERQGRRD
jgi:hypothetical protein